MLLWRNATLINQVLLLRKGRFVVGAAVAEQGKD